MSTRGQTPGTRTRRAPGALTPAAEAHGRQRDALGAGDELVDRHVLVGRVCAADVARAEADGRDAGLDREGRAVVPVVHAAEVGRLAEVAAGRQERLHDRIVRGDLGRRHAALAPGDLGRMLAQPRVGGRLVGDPLGELALDQGAVAALVGAVGEVFDVALQRARGRIGDEPLAARDDRGHAVSGRQVRVPRTLRPVLAQPLDCSEHDGHLLDRVDRSALLGRQLCDARMAGAAVHRDAREQTAAARDPDRELGRLGHDGGVGLQQTGGEQAAGTGRLLVGDRVDDQIARQRHAQIGQRAGRDDHARDAALHVARPAAVEQTLALDRRERVRERPGRARLDVDDVDVAVEQKGTTAAGSRGSARRAAGGPRT